MNIGVTSEKKTRIKHKRKLCSILSALFENSIFHKTDKRIEKISYEILIVKMPVSVQIILNILKMKGTND